MYATLRELLRQIGSRSLATGQINFVGDDDLWLGAELRIEAFELVIDRGEIVQRVAAAETTGVQHVDENGGARDVSQETRTQSVTFVCALDQSGDVGEH